METRQGGHGRSDRDLRRQGFQEQGEVLAAFASTQSQKSPLLLPKGVAQICSLNVDLHMNSLIYARRSRCGAHGLKPKFRDCRRKRRCPRSVADIRPVESALST